MTKKEQIITEWGKTTTVVIHPSYRQIAKTVGCQHAYAYQVIKKYLKNLTVKEKK